MIKTCKQCNTEFNATRSVRKFCSHFCYGEHRIGKFAFVMSEKQKELLRKNALERGYKPPSRKGSVASEETKRKIGAIHRGNKYNLGLKRSEKTKNKLRALTGEKNSRYLVDRTKLKKTNRQGNPLYLEWRYKIYTRDGFKCKMSNKDCCGRLEAHHILRWSDHPELRYDVNNGITLCHFHHPLKKSEEIRLSPYFYELIANQP